MNSIERTFAVLKHEIPDRIPVDLHNFLVSAHQANFPFSQCFRNGEMMAEAQIKAWHEYKHDILLLENGVASSAEALGCPVNYYDDKAPTVVAPIIHNYKDVDKLKVPDPYNTFPLNELLKATRIVVKEIGDKAFIVGRADQGAFSLASALRGYQNLLMDVALGQDLEKIHKLLSFCNEVIKRYALAQLEMGAHSTSIGDLGTEITSPQIARDFIFPYAKELFSVIHNKKKPAALHMCGNSTPIVADMVATGADIIELDHKTDMQAAKIAARGKAAILGVLDPVMLLKGTLKDVEESAKECIKILGPGGGFILGPGCALPADTPAQNIHMLIECSHKYGHY